MIGVTTQGLIFHHVEPHGKEHGKCNGSWADMGLHRVSRNVSSRTNTRRLRSAVQTLSRVSQVDLKIMSVTI